MKNPLDRNKVVLRHLPPTISPAVLAEQVDTRFAGRYTWTAFQSGKASHKNMRYARAYINFKGPEDVLEFAEFFDGHVFVNEKGAQFKTIVEYAPSQRIPKPCPKDGREGTIYKDSEYLGFVEMLAKPPENIPSAEIQLERKEAERVGGSKEAIIVTPLMLFVRQKRASRSGPQRLSSSGKLSRRAGGASNAGSASLPHKRSHEKKRGSTSMYVLRESAKASTSKKKSSGMVAARKDEQQIIDESGLVPVVASEAVEDESGAPAHVDAGKKKVIFLKGKEKKVFEGPGDVSQPATVSPGSTSLRQNHRHEIGKRVIKSILSNKEPRQNQPPEQLLGSQMEKDKHQPFLNHSVSKDHVTSSISSVESDTKRTMDERAVSNDLQGHGSTSDRPDRRTRNKDRPERGVWAPLRHPDGLRTTDDSLSSSSVPGVSSSELANLTRGFKRVVAGKHGYDELEVTGTKSGNQPLTKVKPQRQNAENQNISLGNPAPSSYLSLNQTEAKAETNRNADAKAQVSDYTNVMSTENGSHRYGRRGPIAGSREIDSSPSALDGKPSKRGSPGFGAHERQIWVQKSGSGS